MKNNPRPKISVPYNIGMGQYYRVAVKPDGQDVKVNSRKEFGGNYVGLKLMEHAYLRNGLCKSVAAMLSTCPCRVAWVGDYAEDEELKGLTNGELHYGMVWKEDGLKYPFDEWDFSFAGKFLVNRTKGLYLSFDEHSEKCGQDICPFALLTAVGNGRGGGDYCGTSQDSVGSWCWDDLSIVDEEPKDGGLTKTDVFFKEEF